MRRVFLTLGDRDKNQLPSGTNLVHRAEQQNLASPLTRRSKTDAWTPSVVWALGSTEISLTADLGRGEVGGNGFLCPTNHTVRLTTETIQRQDG